LSHCRSRNGKGGGTEGGENGEKKEGQSAKKGQRTPQPERSQVERRQGEGLSQNVTDYRARAQKRKRVRPPSERGGNQRERGGLCKEQMNASFIKVYREGKKGQDLRKKGGEQRRRKK